MASYLPPCRGLKFKHSTQVCTTQTMTVVRQDFPCKCKVLMNDICALKSLTAIRTALFYAALTGTPAHCTETLPPFYVLFPSPLLGISALVLPATLLHAPLSSADSAPTDMWGNQHLESTQNVIHFSIQVFGSIASTATNLGDHVLHERICSSIELIWVQNIHTSLSLLAIRKQRILMHSTWSSPFHTLDMNCSLLFSLSIVSVFMFTFSYMVGNIFSSLSFSYASPFLTFSFFNATLVSLNLSSSEVIFFSATFNSDCCSPDCLTKTASRCFSWCRCKCSIDTDLWTKVGAKLSPNSLYYFLSKELLPLLPSHHLKMTHTTHTVTMIL